MWFFKRQTLARRSNPDGQPVRKSSEIGLSPGWSRSKTGLTIVCWEGHSFDPEENSKHGQKRGGRAERRKKRAGHRH
jgi:hypothetical protein